MHVGYTVSMLFRLLLASCTTSQILAYHTSDAVLAVQARASAGNCTRALLEHVTDRYTAAQSTGEVRWLDRVSAPNVSFTENEQATSMPDSRLGRPLRVDRSRTLYDLAQCAVFVETIASDPEDPWVVGAQIRLAPTLLYSTSTHHSNTTRERFRVVQIDRIATTTGDWLFNATRTLHYALREDWGTLPASQRVSRDELRAAADAYFDMLGNHSLPVPWGYPCTRLEGGSYTGTGRRNDTCAMDIPANTTMRAPHRRYVIDEHVGGVSMLLQFGGFGNAPDSHTFRIVDGKLRRVHTMTYCKDKPNCGVEPPPGAVSAEDPGF